MQLLERETTSLLGSLNDSEQTHAPQSLFTAGDVTLLRRCPRVSVIGSRKATKDGIAKAEIISRLIVEREGVVVSGLAEGIDTAAHTAAIEAGGKTIAVIGTPLDRAYPKSNEALQKKIMMEHLVLSQFAPGSNVQPKNFVIRNRTMALISHASVIVEAGEKSGTEHQGWEAIRLGRTLLLPQALVDAPFSWPRKMCSYGAIPFRSKNELEAILDEKLPTILAEAFSEAPF